jgi:hypothetical protein
MPPAPWPAWPHGHDRNAPAEKPLVLITTLGTTEASVRRVRQALESDGCEVMVFHSSGAGGPTLDGLAQAKDVALVLDLSQTEILDHLMGGLADSGPDRGKAARPRHSHGAGARQCGFSSSPARSTWRAVPRPPLSRAQSAAPCATTIDDLKRLADHLAANVAAARGPVHVITPLWHQPRQPQVISWTAPCPRRSPTICATMPAHVPVQVIDAQADPAFSDAVIATAGLAGRAHPRGLSPPEGTAVIQTFHSPPKTWPRLPRSSPNPAIANSM